MNMRKSDNDAMALNLLLSLSNGWNRSSCLKPSSMVSIMKSIPRVCQSMAFTRSAEGGVIKSEIRAASSETGSMGSFFMSSNIFFIGAIVSQIRGSTSTCHIVFKTI